MGIFDNVVKKTLETDVNKQKTINDKKKKNSDSGNTSDDEDVYYEVVTNSGNLNVRKTPSMDGAVLGGLPKGTIVLLLDDSNDEWLKVRSEAFKLEGYCSSKYLRKQS